MDKRDVETIYSLSPLQQGLLFHALYAPAEGLYISQSAHTLNGITVAAFKRAWTRLIAQHPVLRTAFVWERLDQPVQVVLKRCDLPWEEHDWSGVPAAELEGHLEEFLESDRRRGFRLTSAPLLRLSLASLGDDRYYFVWTSHHIVLDGWSIPLLLRDVSLLYEAERTGGEVKLGSRRPYRDYIEWLGRQDLAAAREFWRSQLDGIRPCSLFGAGGTFGRSLGPGSGGDGEQSLSWTIGETERLRALARRQRITMGTLLAGAWVALLLRYSGESEMIFGQTVSGRPAELGGVSEMVGMFVNTLPMRVCLENGERVGEWLAKLQRQQAEVRQYEYSSLSDVQVWSGGNTGVDLFETMVVYENYPVDEIGAEAGRHLGVSESRAVALTHYPITLVGSGREGLEVKLIYKERLLDGPTVKRILDHLRDAIAWLAENGERPVAELPLLTESERQQLLVEWNETAAEYAAGKCIHELVEERARLRPNAVAVSYEGQRLTYGELNGRANQLARYLQRLGVEVEARVGLCVERSLEMVVGMLGVLKAGGAYVPLDPRTPLERLSYMLADAGVSVLLTQASVRQRLPEYSGTVVLLDEEWEEISGESGANLEGDISPDNLAYVIYTSGSTGQPKGVLVTHRGVPNLAAAQAVAFGIGEESRVLQFATPAFDASVSEVWVTLAAGARLVLAEAERLLPGGGLGELLREQEVTVVTLPPSVLRRVAGTEAEALARLSTVVAAGEACEARLAQQWSQGRRFCNAYGPTEVTVCATIWIADEASNAREAEGWAAIGKPLANTQVYVVDEQLRLAPVGVTGELCVGGVGLGRGYAGLPGLTAERFIPNPFSGEAGVRLYRTGDVVRWLGSGELEFVGRRDSQVKVRGYRIELGEIEEVMKRAGQVREAVVVAREEDGGERRLVAYVVRQGEMGGSDTPLDVRELREPMRQVLPEYMVPGVIVELGEMPQTSSGKVDRRALAQLEVKGQGQREGSYQGARTLVEEGLCGLWQELLQVEHIGIKDNFFELGGHSLLATQLVSRVREAFGVELGLRELFERPTVAGLAEKVEAGLRGGNSATVPPLVAVSREERELPLSYAQQRLWFLDQLEPGSVAYNIPAAVRLRGQLDVGALERTLTEVVRRHEVLRTRIEVVNGAAVQVITSQAEVTLPVVDLSEMQVEEREGEARRIAEAEAQQPFALSVGPLLRVKLLRLGEEEHVVLFTLHHIVSDGWSTGILVREVAALYEAYKEGRESRLAELTIQYADYAVWQREWLQGEVLEQQLAYWRRQLGGELGHQSGGELPILQLPTDKPRPTVPTYRGATRSLTLSDELSKQINALARREGVTTFMTFLAAFHVLLRAYTGQSDLCIGTPIAGRGRLETENLIGLFVNTIVLRLNHADDPTFKQLLRHVKDVVLEAYTNQDIAFEKLVEELQPERRLTRTPLFEVMFTLDIAPAQPLNLKDLTLTPLETPNHIAKFDLTLSVVQRAQKFECAVEYSTDLFDASTAERMLLHLQTILKAATTNAGTPLSQMSLLTERERQQLTEWNNTRAPFPLDQCVHQLFEEQVQRNPDAVAVIYENQKLTYRELNARANQLAQCLRRAGVSAESRVGLCVERSLEMVVGMLGILKAGGAYVPLDPQYPTERLSYMLDDAEVSVLLTQAAVRDKLPEHAATMVLLDQIEGEETNPDCRIGPDNLAYVIYTSGSTGTPKGVMVTHRSLNNLCFATAESYDLDETDRVFQFASLSFDVAAEELFPSLLRGATVVLSPPTAVNSLTAFSQLLRDARVTVVNLPPAHWHAWTTEETRQGKTAPEHLRLVVVGSDRVSGQQLADWQNGPYREIRLKNAYGLTETTVTTTLFEATANQNGSGNMPIGRPIANTQVYITDERLRLAPVGVIGELCVGGAGLARGYVGQPGLTAERFIPNPFSVDEGARLYRTGDMARWLNSGELQFVGRRDSQVKVRGYRIELGEIESALRKQAGVSDAAAVVQDDKRNAPRILGYVVAGPEIKVNQLQERLKQVLPGYMTPSVIVVLDELPQTASGKVDRRALAQLEVSGEESYQTPRTPVEEGLCGLWQELLYVERVGINDNFFELGGHSLLATQLVSRVREAFGVELPLRELFEQPTVAALAEKVEAGLRGGDNAAAPPLVPVSRERELPLSYAQQRLWFMDQWEPGNVAYNIPTVVRLSGKLDVTALERAFVEIIRRHEVLRASFPMTQEGQPTLSIAATTPTFFRVLDLSGTSDEESVRRFVDEETRRPFDLAHGPLIRAALLTIQAGDHVLVFTMHHIVGDGWSVGVFIREITVLYEAYVSRRESPLKALPIQYADYAVWQREWLQGEVLERQLKYWRRQLQGDLPILQLPAGESRSTVPSFRGRTQTYVFPDELGARLRELNRREGATLFMTMFAAFNVLLNRYTQHEDILVGTAIANRNRMETEHLIGLFLNMLVLRTDLSGDPTFIELLRHVRQVTLDAYAHQDLPLEKIIDELRVERKLEKSPLFQVLFGIQNAPLAPVRLPDLTLTPVEFDLESVKFDLTVWIAERGEQLLVTWTYRTDLFDETAIKTMHGHYSRLLQSIIEAPHERLSTFEMLTAEEQNARTQKKRELKEVNLKRFQSARPKGMAISQ